MPRHHHPANVARAKYDYEEGIDPVPVIADRRGMGVRTLMRYAREDGWKRRGRRETPSATRLLDAATALEVQAGAPTNAGRAGPVHPPPAGREHERDRTSEPAACDELAPDADPAIADPLPGMLADPRAPAMDGTPAAPSPALLAAIESVERQVHAQLAIEEVRAHGRRPATRAGAANTARTLATHTQTLQKLAALRRGESQPGEHGHDEFPRDLDERRRELARRIHAFVDSRSGGALDGESRCADAASDRA